MNDHAWLNEVNPESYLSSRDVCEVTEITRGMLFLRIKNGVFPKPDRINICGRYRSRKFFWKVKTILGLLADA